MYSEDHLSSAIRAGILTHDTAEAFREHVRQLDHSSIPDEERFRLVSGFNDIFVVIACLLMLLSVAMIGASVGPWLGGLAVAVAAWGLAEFFVRKRLMALPAIVLLLAFEFGLISGVLGLFHRAPGQVGLTGWGITSATAAVGAGLHWFRFKVPITLAAGLAAVIAFLTALLQSITPQAQDWIPAISLVAGTTAFVIAMGWDAADTLRLTRKSDVAF